MGETDHIVVCVDDTDDLSKETSTGAVAEALAAGVRRMGGSVDLDVTRHQLLLDERVPYTSHNSSMAFTALLPAGALDAFAEDAAWVVRSMMAPSANPGLAYGVVPQEDAALAELVAFGFAAQREYFELDDAFALTQRTGWLQLRALGGTGWGAIGALAGAGLRLSGNDGRFRGTWDALCRELADGAGQQAVPLARVQAALEGKLRGTVAVRGTRGQVFAPGTPVLLRKNAKAVLRGGAFVVLAEERGGVLWPCTKRELDALAGSGQAALCCGAFAFDNDAEEFGDDAAQRTCPNCLYRRLTASGYACVGGALAARQEACA